MPEPDEHRSSGEPAPPPLGEEPREVRVVAHTHWDREWYLTAEEFRPALVDLVDEVLAGGAGEHFLLDGQTIVLEDYLDARPGCLAGLRRALQERRLEAGPWYVLADNLIPGGEALVRNLQFGRETLRRLGAVPPPVLYCPDSFGHPAVLPLLAAGFALPVVIAWRGLGGPRWPAGDTFRWRSHGEEALLFHLPPEGYELGSNLPVGSGEAKERWDAMRRVLAPRSSTGILLVQNGADHHAVQHRRDEAIDQLGRVAAPTPVVPSSLAAFAERLRGAVASRPLPRIEGELRDSTGYTWALQGTFGSRAAQKRANAAAERLLVRDVEPWIALAAWSGAGDMRHELVIPWRTLLACHPHDTLCGCSTDAVAEAMDHRLGVVHRAGNRAGQRARMRLLGHDGSAAREREGAWRHVVVVRNRSAFPRGGVAELEVDVPLAAIPVGPGSGTVEMIGRPSPAISVGDVPVALQLLASTRTFAREESPRHYPRNMLVERRRFLAWLPAIPGYSLAVLPVDERRRSARPGQVARADAGAIDNGTLRVWVERGGVCIVTADGHRLDDVVGFEDVGERGDLYTHSPIPGTEGVATLVSARVTMRGPLRSELTTRWRAEVAPRRLHAATGAPTVHPRTSLVIEVRFQLDAGARFVRCVVRGRNGAPDHRLRVVVRTALASHTIWCDAAFGPLQRPLAAAPAPDVAPEQSWRTAPLHRYVSRFAGDRGCTVMSDGLAEYEAMRGGDVAITLLRATGELSRNDLLERPGHAGWPHATPGAQSVALFECAVAIRPHGTRTDDVVREIDEDCEAFLLPLVGASWRSAVDPPSSAGGLALEGDGLAFSACQPGAAEGEMILRCFNLQQRAVEGAWRVAGIASAALVRLDGTPLGELPVHDGRVRFVAAAHAVVSVLVRRQ